MQPQRLVVPLFQRPYVWTREHQWEPLWEDVQRLADRMLAGPSDKHQPHFLGAVVLQQVAKATGSLQERTVIDGQQRPTTLQILLDAMHAELTAVGATPQAKRIEALVTNDSAFWEQEGDRFKVWPTNRDRPAFNAVMGAPPPVAYDELPEKSARLVEAHRYFAEQVRGWVRAQGEAQQPTRASALEKAARELLQVVVIDLNADENAQEIFETLNARGAQLTAADLIKNFVFQRIVDEGVDVEKAYASHWRDFETGFWEAEVSSGRVRYSRASVFLNHWLTARTGEEVVGREVFARFKQYASFDAGKPMNLLLAEIHRAANVYRSFVEQSKALTGPLDRLGLFAYRTSVLESEVIKPLVLVLLDPELPAIPEAQLHKALDVLESWLVRRMLVRATTKSYTQVVSELVALLLQSDRSAAGDVLEAQLRKQAGASRYWPDDSEMRRELLSCPAYRRLGRGRLRMVFEALEDDLRGWRGEQAGIGGERVGRGVMAIEHVMPRKWQTHWPLPPGADESEREQLIHTLGNLTLLTQRLNSSVSHGAWQGGSPGGKWAALEKHDVLHLNRALVKGAPTSWDESRIAERTRVLVEQILTIWKVPAGHATEYGERPMVRRRVGVVDLMQAGLLAPGSELFIRKKKHAHRVVTVLQDGQLDVDGTVYASPSAAATKLDGTPRNGWGFFLVQRSPNKSLHKVWREYVDSLSEDVEDEDAADDDSDDE